jgi:alkanesulfonate monooxygenase SsuD/methylene tetrahydromethanopterin reductase-like flavin-dependent oxidoreductase (luciferase family)
MKTGILGFITETSVDTMTFGRKAESLGFDTFYLPEHPTIPVVRKSAYPASADGVMPEGLAHFIDPFNGLAQAAAGTTHGWLVVRCAASWCSIM